MSRWNQEFENHPFREPWAAIKELAESESVDDETVETAVHELNRLRKIVHYTDELMAGIDPELVPLATWNQFNKQAVACREALQQYGSTRQEEQLQAANNHADNLLTYVRPYMVLTENAAEAVNKAAQIYVGIANESLTKFRNSADEVLANLKEVKIDAEARRAAIVDIEQMISELEGRLFGGDDVEGLAAKIDDLASRATEHEERIAEAYGEILGNRDTASSGLLQATRDAHAEAMTEKTALAELVSEVTSEVNELREFHERAFGDSDDEESRGIDGELNALIARLRDFEKGATARHFALEKRIEHLLPGATSAGLSSAYKNLKDSFARPIVVWTWVFYFCIGTLVTIAFVSTIDTIGGEQLVKFRDYSDWQVLVRGVLFKVPLYAPLIWLAYFVSKRRSEAQRLMQEYAHKEAVASSYISYKKQLDELKEEGQELRLKLLQATIDTVDRNASTTLDGAHGDKSPTHQAVEGLQALSDIPLIKKLVGK